MALKAFRQAAVSPVNDRYRTVPSESLLGFKRYASTCMSRFVNSGLLESDAVVIFRRKESKIRRKTKNGFHTCAAPPPPHRASPASTPALSLQKPLGGGAQDIFLRLHFRQPAVAGEPAVKRRPLRGIGRPQLQSVIEKQVIEVVHRADEIIRRLPLARGNEGVPGILGFLSRGQVGHGHLQALERFEGAQFLLVAPQRRTRGSARARPPGGCSVSHSCRRPQTILRRARQGDSAIHPGDQIRLRRLGHQMKMIRQEQVGVNLFTL